jgi:Thiol:disulfide interchange protein DsbD, N-terminal
LWRLLLLYFLPLLASAQLGNEVLTAPQPEPLTVKRGQDVHYVLKLQLKSGYHVNSDKPKDEFLIPLKLTWAAGPLQTKSITYPKPEEVSVGSDTLSVFTGAFSIETEFFTPGQAAPGLSQLQGKLHYQACDSRSCKRPAWLEVRVPVSIQ